jgi:hypothetical protein
MKINELNNVYSNDELNLLIYNIASLPKDKQDLVEAYVKGLIDNN